MIVVRRGTLHIAETRGALALAEATHPPVRDVLGESGLNSVWTYETPFEAVGDIAGYLALYPDGMSIELDDEASLRKQSSIIPIRNR
ncbi:hypothetical protein ACQR16_13155 [Bradyrhizobium oligotrophicum]|uniref:hypothetical protein n=1 Tax=Bradyrhizobium oligotrophicum TaxID=44255 RepID=UPI003EBEB462